MDIKMGFWADGTKLTSIVPRLSQCHSQSRQISKQPPCVPNTTGTQETANLELRIECSAGNRRCEDAQLDSC